MLVLVPPSSVLLHVLAQVCQAVHQVAPTRLLGKQKPLIKVFHHTRVVGGCNVRSIKVEAIEPHQLTGVATLLHNEWASFSRVGQADDLAARAGEEVSQIPRFLDQRCVATCAQEGEAQIGAERFKVGAGDFIGFPLDGKAHTIVNTGAEDLVYLTGGEDMPTDIGHFPSIGKMAVFKPDGIELIDESAGKTYSFQQWIAGDLK